jgi:hypothetical protein
MVNSCLESIRSYANLFGSFIHVDVPCKKHIHSQILQSSCKCLLKLLVFSTIFLLILLAAIGRVVGESDHCLLFNCCPCFWWKLLCNHVGEVLILLLEGDFKKA